MNEGNCLCGSVTWELTGEPYAAYNCHCVMCQKIHGTPFGTYYFVAPISSAGRAIRTASFTTARLTP